MMHNSTLEPRLLPTTTILGETVKNLQGEELGQIRDLIVDMEADCIAYAVLSFGGFLGLGKKLFPVPWNAVTLCEQDFCIDIGREQFERGPGFDRENWPDVADRRWGAEVHRYYNLRPYWEHHACG